MTPTAKKALAYAMFAVVMALIYLVISFTVDVIFRWFGDEEGISITSTMITCLVFTTAIVLVLVVLPAGLISRIKRENHPETLTEFNKGYHVINVILAAILIGLCITAVIVKSEMMWMGLAFGFIALYHLLNSFIFYNARKTYVAENSENE